MVTTYPSSLARSTKQRNVPATGTENGARCQDSGLAATLPASTSPSGFASNRYATHDPSSNRSHETRPPLTSATILVVDDEPIIAAVISRWLRQAGFTVETAHSASEALELLSTVRFDALLADAHLPTVRGETVMQVARSQEQEIAVLLITTGHEIAEMAAYLNAGISDYVTKPFDLNDLVARVRRALERRTLLRESNAHLRELEQRIADQAVELRRTGHGSLAALIHALEAKDSSTCNHSARVSCMATLLTKHLHPQDAALAERVRVAALLHDIGKIGVSEAVLRKCGRLTTDEMAQVQRHAEVGATILGPLLDAETVEMVLSHHEHINGCGYPRQLSGESIPLGGRIIAVADAFDAMTSTRPYRDKMTITRVHEVMQDGAGSQWDPVIVRALIELTQDDALRERIMLQTA